MQIIPKDEVFALMTRLIEPDPITREQAQKYHPGQVGLILEEMEMEEKLKKEEVAEEGDLDKIEGRYN